ncbi:MAG: spermidine/putrescine ABC transporter permease PotC [Firmicutes bacterium HGW-Firmicutes-7]|nr:MAG: spermidine/putrescine ABC transporter permease PotC [Firmicutes bacterium HGW-Firmicutes-7]
MFLVYAFIYIPILILIIFSFNESRLNVVWTGFTLDWYGKLMKNHEVIRALINTVKVAFATTIISTVIGTLTAVGMYRYKFKGKVVLDNLLYIPMVIPEIVLGIALLIFFNKTNIPLGLWTLIIAHSTFCIPFVVITVKSRMAGFDKAQEEAAMDLGAGQFKTFIYITLPNILPGVIAGALLSFTLSLDDVITSFFVAGPRSTTLPLQIFSMVKFGVSPEINALSTLMLLTSLTLALLSEKFKTK